MLLPSARDCADSVAATNTMASYFILALSQIATALGSGSYSCTLTTSGKANADVIAINKALRDLGYYVTTSGSTITIKWDGSSPAVSITY